MAAEPAAASYSKNSPKERERRFKTKLIGLCIKYVGYRLQKLLGNPHYSVMGIWRNGKVRYYPTTLFLKPPQHRS